MLLLCSLSGDEISILLEFYEKYCFWFVVVWMFLNFDEGIIKL